MNKNTRAARKKGLSNMPETTNGTGTSRQIVARHAEPIFKGEACDTAWGSKNNKNRSRKTYKRQTQADN